MENQYKFTITATKTEIYNITRTIGFILDGSLEHLHSDALTLRKLLLNKLAEIKKEEESNEKSER